MGKSRFRTFDAFQKTVEEARIKTASGGLVTLISAAIIFWLLILEVWDWRRIVVRNELVVDKDRGERLHIRLNMTFPHLPCAMLSLDVMDASGEVQTDVASTLFKTRLDGDGTPIDVAKMDVGFNYEPPPEDYCGPCYGGKSPHEDGCCNTCQDVRDAYQANGWAIGDYNALEQCAREHYKENLQSQSHEGCNLAGYIRVNKVSGNFHIAPGRSFAINGMHIHDTAEYFSQEDGLAKHNPTHIIHDLRFGPEVGEERIGGADWSNPLRGTEKHTEDGSYLTIFPGNVALIIANFNYLYFLKCVSTTYHYLGSSRRPLNSHQYSTTSHSRPLAGGQDPDHAHAVHSRGGVPGVFFVYDISPMRVIKTEERGNTFGGFLAAVVGGVGGVLVIAGWIDRGVWEVESKLKKKAREGKYL